MKRPQAGSYQHEPTNDDYADREDQQRPDALAVTMVIRARGGQARRQAKPQPHRLPFRIIECIAMDMVNVEGAGARKHHKAERQQRQHRKAQCGRGTALARGDVVRGCASKREPVSIPLRPSGAAGNGTQRASRVRASPPEAGVRQKLGGPGRSEPTSG